MKTTISRLARLLLGATLLSAIPLQSPAQNALEHAPEHTRQTEPAFSAYLFAYFTGNKPGEEQIRFAVSEDGFNFRALNDNKPILDSREISASGGVRDPHIMRGNDGKSFYMVATDLNGSMGGWKSNQGMILLKSTDLIHWKHSIVDIPKTFPKEFGDVHRVWAPQTIHDPQTGKYMVYFSMKAKNEPDTIYYAYANRDFTGLESVPKQLYFPPADSKAKACIDGDIIYKDGKYHLFYKAEDGDRGIKLAISNRLTGDYQLYSQARIDKSRDPVEGSCVFKLNGSNEWILMYDVYTRGRYQFTRSSDLLNFQIIDHEISMDFHPRHGTVMPITREEFARLLAKWGTPAMSLKPTSDHVKIRNVSTDPTTGILQLPVKPGVNPEALDPQFQSAPGAVVTPSGPRDFSKGPVEYTASYPGNEKRTFRVTAVRWNNPVLDGYYADPDILFSQKTGKYYLYPTSDGFPGWSSTHFEAFSSGDLVNWKNEGVILDLKKQVPWGNRNAWAPCIIEKKIAGNYRYFYYFTAAQKIGVAVSDNPTGPFKDSGHPLVSAFPPGVERGQQIDPAVFADPQSGISYLYWGNGYLAGAELNDDMLSIKEGTVRVLTPDKTFREGTHVFFRRGLYYFLWSENDTRSENYRVRYATARSPLGPLEIPRDNLVIAKDPTKGIYATGHNSTLQIPGKDEWVLVYHRFTYPEGIGMGEAAGFRREVCIDKMEFGPSGEILPVQPTHEGISSPL